jgi:hypothetical protein
MFVAARHHLRPQAQPPSALRRKCAGVLCRPQQHRTADTPVAATAWRPPQRARRRLSLSSADSNSDALYHPGSVSETPYHPADISAAQIAAAVAQNPGIVNEVERLVPAEQKKAVREQLKLVLSNKALAAEACVRGVVVRASCKIAPAVGVAVRRATVRRAMSPRCRPHTHIFPAQAKQRSCRRHSKQ